MTSRTSTRVAIHSSAVKIDEIIPRPTSKSEVQREDDDVQQLIPWPFLTVDVLEDVSSGRWPRDQWKFRQFFNHFESHLLRLEKLKITGGLESANGETSSVPIVRITVVLPRKNWHVPAIRKESIVRDSQSAMLCYLFHDICGGLEDSLDPGQDCELNLRLSHLKLSYVIGGQRFGAITKGAVIIGPISQPVPVISFTGWFEGKTWNDFLIENLCVMFGQIAQNVRTDSGSTEDQESFAVGFHGARFYIVRGYFTADAISRVHRNGFSEDDIVELKSTRGYNFILKHDWLEATRALTRLLRYLRSGNAKIGVMRAMLSRQKPATIRRV